MHKFIAIGDVHAEWDTFWEALRAASCVDADGLPTPPVRLGRYQVVVIGDLVHPKSPEAYTRLTGCDPFDMNDEDHRLIAAREQVRQLEKLQRYQAAAPHAVHVILGNHDDAVLDPRFVLGTSGGLKHVEFDPEHGGLLLPPPPARLDEPLSTGAAGGPPAICPRLAAARPPVLRRPVLQRPQRQNLVS